MDESQEQQQPEDFDEYEDQQPKRKNPFDKIRGLGEKLTSFFPSLLHAVSKLIPSKAQSQTESETEEKETEDGGAVEVAPGVLSKLEAGLAEKSPAFIRPLVARFGRWIIIGLAIAALLFFVKSCFFKKHEAPKVSLEESVSDQEKKPEGPVPVKGFKVGRFNFEDSLNALGTIKGAVEFKLSFEIPGTISSINYREGERYEEGALLVSLKQDDILLRLKRSQADLNKAQTQSQIAKEKVKDHDKLYAMGAITKSTLENVNLELESAEYEAEAARLEVKANEAMLEKSNLYAPSAGMIGELNIEEGETITQNTLLGTHVNTEFVYAEFGIVERDVNKIALGQKARVFIDAYPDKTFEGVIENIAPVVAGTSRTATARVRIENPERLLLPGMFARIRILLYSKKNTLVLPTDAIQGGEGEQSVYVVHLDQDEKASEDADAAQVILPDEGAHKKSGKKKSKAQEEADAEDAAAQELTNKTAGSVEKRAITVGYTRPDYSQIDAGVSEGEVIAISGLERLEDGKKVRLLETQEAEI